MSAHRSGHLVKSLAWLRPARHEKLSTKAPQRQCGERRAHGAHGFADQRGLIWRCQGRGS